MNDAKKDVKQENDEQRARRLARARAFLEAGRTQVEPGPAEAPSPPPRRSATAGEDAPRDTGDSGAGDSPDPTRFGDWEKKGRCIDF